MAETGNPKWNGHDVLRMQGQRDGKALREYVAPGEQGAIVGGVSRTARVLDKSADVRDRYVSDVAKLDGFDNDGRAALKEYWRKPMPPETREILEKVRPDKGPGEGSHGRANVTNPKVNEQIRVMRRLGRGAGVVGAGLAAADMVTSDDPWKAGVANAGAIVGGVLGGAGGAFLGGLAGPGAFVAAPTLGVAGSVAGGGLGYDVGEEVYDRLRAHFGRR